MNTNDKANGSTSTVTRGVNGKALNHAPQDLGVLLRAAYDAGLLTAREAGYRQVYDAGFKAGVRSRESAVRSQEESGGKP